MERLIHGATRLLLWLSGLSLFGLACITVMEVILRYAGSPTSWANDFVGYGLAFSLFFAFPEVTRVKGHVAITFLMDNLPNRLSLVRFMNLVSFLVVAVTIYVAVQVFFVQLSTGVQTVSATPIPKSWLNAGLIIGLSVAALEFLLHIVHSDSSLHCCFVSRGVDCSLFVACLSPTHLSRFLVGECGHSTLPDRAIRLRHVC